MTPSLEIGNGNWAVQSDSLLGYKTINGKYYPREMSVTRATTATRVNAAGLVELVPYNLVSYSEDFTNVYWVKQFSTVLSNTVNSPINTLTADTLLAVTGGGTQYSQLYNILNANSGTTYSISVYAKKNSSNFVFFREYFSTGTQNITWFNLLTGQIGTTNPNHIATIVDVGGGWYRCIITTTTNAARNQSFGIGVSDLDNSYIITATSSIFIWGAQLVEGTEPLNYLPTTDRLDIARVDYSTGEAALLVEPQRTNNSRWSEDLTNGVWSKAAASVVISADNTISPSGIQNADRVSGATGAAIWAAPNTLNQQLGSLTSNTLYTITIYLRSSTTSSQVTLVLRDQSTGLQSQIVCNLTSSWQRFEISRTTGATTTALGVVLGEATADFFAWGLQGEAGAFPTSYIPTTTASVTRNTDVISRSNIFTNGYITSAGGTWFLELMNNRVLTRDGSTPLGIFINTGTSINAGNGISIRNGGGTQRVVIFKLIADVQTAIFTTSADTAKIAIKWNGTTADIFENGVKVVAATAFTPTAMENLIGNGGATPFYINSMSLYTTPLSDTELVNLTTL